MKGKTSTNLLYPLEKKTHQTPLPQEIVRIKYITALSYISHNFLVLPILQLHTILLLRYLQS